LVGDESKPRPEAKMKTAGGGRDEPDQMKKEVGWAREMKGEAT